MKRKLFTSIVLALSAIACMGNPVQSPNYDIRIGIVVQQQPGQDYVQRQQLRNAMSDIVTRWGIGADDATVALIPSLVVERESVVNGAVMVEANLHLSLRNASDGSLFYSHSRNFTGIGTDRYSAVNNVIANIRSAGESFDGFLNTGYDRIVGFYENNRDRIFATASAMASMDNYDRAVAYLMSVPENVSYYGNMLVKASELYTAHADLLAGDALQYANNWFAAGEFDIALQYLRDPVLLRSRYADQVQTFLLVIAEFISEEKRIEQELYVERAMVEIRRDTNNIEAMESIMRKLLDYHFEMMEAHGTGYFEQ